MPGKGKEQPADPTVTPGTPAGANPATGELTFEIWENQRHRAFKGWGYHRLPVDRPNWSNKKGDVTLHTESTLLPIGYEWIGPWSVAQHGEEGWYYAADYTIPTRFCSTKSGPLSMVRRRKWIRTCKPLGEAGLTKDEASRTNHTYWSGVENYGFPGLSAEEALDDQTKQHLAFAIISPYSLSALTQKIPRTAPSDSSSTTSPPSHHQPQFNAGENSLAATGSSSSTAGGNSTNTPSKGEGGDEGFLVSSPTSPFGKVEDDEWAPRLKTSADVSKCIYKYGVPFVQRNLLWFRWSGAIQLKQKNPEYFATLSSQASVITSGETWQEIIQDVVRTAPRHPYFEGRGSAGSLRLTNTLLALSLHQPHGAPPYHQAFSYIMAVLLLNLQPEDAFWTMNCLLERFLPRGYHENYLLQYDLRIITELIRECFPELDECMERNQIDVGVFASGWLQGLFCAHFPFPCAARVMDIMLFEGNSSILVRIVVAFIKQNQEEISLMDGSGTLGQFANNYARNVNSIDDVIFAAMNDGLSNKVLQRRNELMSLAKVMSENKKSEEDLLRAATRKEKTEQ